MSQQQTADDLNDARRQMFENYFEGIASLGDVIQSLKYNEEIELPRGIERDLATIESCLMRVEYWLRDELWKLV
jgi:hypothetical protein